MFCFLLRSSNYSVLFDAALAVMLNVTWIEGCVAGAVVKIGVKEKWRSLKENWIFEKSLTSRHIVTLPVLVDVPVYNTNKLLKDGNLLKSERVFNIYIQRSLSLSHTHN